LGNLVDQALAHLLWIDTFVHAGGQSAMHESGQRFLVRLTRKRIQKVETALFSHVRKQLLDGSR
jgi:hypothetical protein